MRRFLRTVGLTLVLFGVALPTAALAGGGGPQEVERRDTHKLLGTRGNREVIGNAFRQDYYMPGAKVQITYDRGLSVSTKHEGNGVFGKFHVKQQVHRGPLLHLQRTARKFSVEIKEGDFKGLKQSGYIYKSRHGNTKVMFFGAGERRNGKLIREAYNPALMQQARDDVERIDKFINSPLGNAVLRKLGDLL